MHSEHVFVEVSTSAGFSFGVVGGIVHYSAIMDVVVFSPLVIVIVSFSFLIHVWTQTDVRVAVNGRLSTVSVIRFQLWFCDNLAAHWRSDGDFTAGEDIVDVVDGNTATSATTAGYPSYDWPQNCTQNGTSTSWFCHLICGRCLCLRLFDGGLRPLCLRMSPGAKRRNQGVLVDCSLLPMAPLGIS